METATHLPPPDTKTFSLKWPIKINGKERSELTFRIPELGDVVRVDAIKQESDREAALLAAICTTEVTIQEILKMKIPDAMRVQRWLVPLLETGSAEGDGAI